MYTSPISAHDAARVSYILSLGGGGIPGRKNSYTD